MYNTKKIILNNTKYIDFFSIYLSIFTYIYIDIERIMIQSRTTKYHYNVVSAIRYENENLTKNKINNSVSCILILRLNGL